MRYKYIVIPLVIFFIISCKKEEPLPVASFTVDKSIAQIGEEITFTNNSSHAKLYEWNFGDGKGTSSEIDPSYSYDEVGIYEIALKAINSTGSSTYKKEMEILAEPRIFAGHKIDNFILGKTWEELEPLITSNYNYISEWKFQIDNSTWSHSIDIPYLQTGLGLLTTTSAFVDSAVLDFIVVYGNYPGKTTDGLGLGNSITDIVSKKGLPPRGVEALSTVHVYNYFYDGIAFLVQKNAVVEIWIFPKSASSESNLSLKSTPPSINRLNHLIGNRFNATKR